MYIHSYLFWFQHKPKYIVSQMFWNVSTSLLHWHWRRPHHWGWNVSEETLASEKVTHTNAYSMQHSEKLTLSCLRRDSNPNVYTCMQTCMYVHVFIHSYLHVYLSSPVYQISLPIIIYVCSPPRWAVSVCHLVERQTRTLEPRCVLCTSHCD